MGDFPGNFGCQLFVFREVAVSIGEGVSMWEDLLVVWWRSLEVEHAPEFNSEIDTEMWTEEYATSFEINLNFQQVENVFLYSYSNHEFQCRYVAWLQAGQEFEGCVWGEASGREQCQYEDFSLDGKMESYLWTAFIGLLRQSNLAKTTIPIEEKTWTSIQIDI